MPTRREFLLGSLAVPALGQVAGATSGAEVVLTVFDSVDAAIGGLLPGEVMQVTASRYSGVSTFLLQVCSNVSETSGVAAFLPHALLPDTAQMFLTQLLTLRARVGLSEFIQGRLDAEELERVASAKNYLPTERLIVSGNLEHRTLTLETLGAAVGRRATVTDLRLVVLDGLEFIDPVNLEGRRSAKDLRRIGTFLHKMANEHQLSVIVGSSLGHRSWRRQDCPRRGDLLPYRLPEEFCPTLVHLRRAGSFLDTGEYQEEVEMRIFGHGQTKAAVLRRKWDSSLKAIGPAANITPTASPAHGLRRTETD